MVTKEVKRARITAVVYGILMGMTLISFVYAFFQKTEAERQASIAVELKQKSEAQARLMKEMTQLSETRNAELERAASDLRDALNAAREDLKKCKGR